MEIRLGLTLSSSLMEALRTITLPADISVGFSRNYTLGTLGSMVNNARFTDFRGSKEWHIE